MKRNKNSKKVEKKANVKIVSKGHGLNKVSSLHCAVKHFEKYK